MLRPWGFVGIICSFYYSLGYACACVHSLAPVFFALALVFYPYLDLALAPAIAPALVPVFAVSVALALAPIFSTVLTYLSAYRGCYRMCCSVKRGKLKQT